MGRFIKELTDKDWENLLDCLGFPRYYKYKPCLAGTETYYDENGYKVYHSYDHIYLDPMDFVECWVAISDFDIKLCHGAEKLIKKLYTFMHQKFGEVYIKQAKQYCITNHKDNRLGYFKKMFGSLEAAEQ